MFLTAPSQLPARTALPGPQARVRATKTLVAELGFSLPLSVSCSAASHAAARGERSVPRGETEVG